MEEARRAARVEAILTDDAPSTSRSPPATS